MDPRWWWLAAGLAVAVELLSVTVYLLLLGGGFAAAALVAHAGMAPWVQIATAAAVALALAGMWRGWRASRGAPLPAPANPDVNLDVGETVHVQHWDAAGMARVQHRGAAWTALQAPGTGAVAAPGRYRIVEVVGSQLVLAPL